MLIAADNPCRLGACRDSHKPEFRFNRIDEHTNRQVHKEFAFSSLQIFYKCNDYRILSFT
jgi:hypothetical protein